MKLADPLPIKFPRDQKVWLMKQARARKGNRRDRSVSRIVREIIAREMQKAETPIMVPLD